MALNTIADLSTTAASNTDFLGSSTVGSVADANTIDTIVQKLAAIMARAYGDIGGLGSVAGSANAITLTSLSTYQALENGLVVSFKAGSANTGATTLNLDGLGAKAVRKSGDVALVAGEIVSGGRYLLIYDEAYNSAAGAWVIQNPSTPANAFQPYDADLLAVANTGVVAFSGLLHGLTLSNNSSDATNDIDIAAGIAIDSTNAAFMRLPSGITKRLDASWAVGTGNGGLDTGSIANTTYHVWLIMRSDTGVVDVLFSASASSPTMPSNYDFRRRIGSIIRASGAILLFDQYGDAFYLRSPPADYSASAPNTSAVTQAISVPSGITVDARITATASLNSPNQTHYLYVSPLTHTDTTPSVTATTVTVPDASGFFTATSETIVPTNTSAQIRWRVTSSSMTVRIVTRGWIDTRGRLA